MRMFCVVCAALFCFSLTASAQDSTAAFDAASSESEPAMPQSLFRAQRLPWQLGMGFQYLHFSVLGQHFSDFGGQGYFTRYFSDSFGLEGQATGGFGHTGPNSSLVAKSVFIGLGPHFAVPTSTRFEPWVHALVGLERFRFTQTAVLGADPGLGFLIGGGVDYKIGEGRLYWRIQGDYIGADISSTFSSNFSFGTGLVVNF